MGKFLLNRVSKQYIDRIFHVEFRNKDNNTNQCLPPGNVLLETPVQKHYFKAPILPKQNEKIISLITLKLWQPFF